jgi:hypothetical protein
MREITKEKAYDVVLQQLALCTVENAKHSAAVIIVDEEKGTVKVFGLNMDEMELPILLIEAASETSDKIKNILNNRTIQ